MIVLLAGLKSIPDDYEEAARIDGATAWQIFRYVTLPLLKTPLLLVAIVLTLSNINTVETPLVMTGGGPGRRDAHPRRSTSTSGPSPISISARRPRSPS